MGAKGIESNAMMFWVLLTLLSVWIFGLPATAWVVGILLVVAFVLEVLN